MLKAKFVVLFLFTLAAFFGKHAHAQANIPMVIQETYIEATVTEIISTYTNSNYGAEHTFQKLILLPSNNIAGNAIEVDTGALPTNNVTLYELGEKLILLEQQYEDGTKNYTIADYSRKLPLTYLFILFAVVIILITKKTAIGALVGMAYSFLIIFEYLLPQILNGKNPLFVAIMAATLISPVTFYLSHGINKKTTIAWISTIVALGLTGVLATVFMKLAYLKGFGSEEAYVLQLAKAGTLDMRGLLLAGIIIGTLGILDDVTISQAAIVAQLKKANESLKFKELYKMAMEVGHDHIASTVNTLVLVYTGAALPLLLLFVNSNQPLSFLINYEVIAEELVRTLVGSIGLVTAVPITTILAAKLISTKDIEGTVPKHHHHHH